MNQIINQFNNLDLALNLGRLKDFGVNPADVTVTPDADDWGVFWLDVELTAFAYRSRREAIEDRELLMKLLEVG